LDDFVGNFAATLEGYCANNGVEGGHEDGFDTGSDEVIRLGGVSMAW
jgi:hypothetical protein